MARIPSGFQPAGHEPVGHHPTSSYDYTFDATAAGSAASTIERYASTFRVDNIVNSNASADAGNRYNICMRTGFRVKPGMLIEDAYGALVRQESFDKRHPQEFVKSRGNDEADGPQFAEADNSFLSASVSPEDL